MTITADDAIAEIANVLTFGPAMADGLDKHTAGCLQCPSCLSTLNDANDIYLNGPGDADTRLKQLAALLNSIHDGAPQANDNRDNSTAADDAGDHEAAAGEQHSFGQCASCTGCRFEFEHAGQIAELALFGVSVSAAWGPGHSRATLRSHDSHSCPSCLRWLDERAAARATIIAAGGNADDLLGDDDSYLNFDDENTTETAPASSAG